MKRNYFLSLGLSTLTTFVAFAGSISPSFSQNKVDNTPDNSTQVNPDNSQSNQVTFICKEIFDNASESNIPATVAWVPQRQGHVRFIAWKSEYFSSWSPKKRCEAVTKNFQKYYNEGRLSYLTTGKRNGYPVICTAKPGETCNKNNHLFTIKQSQNPNLVLQRLVDIATGKASGILYQNSGKQLHVEVQKIFDNGKLIED
ncbi:MAG: COP23 domain-containing protein [Cyanobacteria bacterium J06635_10]